METTQRETGAGPNAEASKVMPTYVVLDTSTSMRPHARLLNDTLVEIVDTFFTSPKLAEFIHLSIISFNTEPHLVMGMTEMANLTAVPRVECNGMTNYAAMFDLVRDQIDIDLQNLKATGVRVLRPVVFMLTDGEPTDGDRQGQLPTDSPAPPWLRAHQRLTDRAWRPYPRIIVYGFGDVTRAESVLKQVATTALYMAEKGIKDQEALASALTSMLNSFVTSANAQQLMLPEQVEGYRSVPLDFVDHLS